jgi:hypothetical protein
MVRQMAPSKLASGICNAVEFCWRTVTFVPARRRASEAASLASISTAVSFLTLNRSRSVVRPGPGPISSISSPSCASSKTQGKISRSRVRLHIPERHRMLWKRFIVAPVQWFPLRQRKVRNGRSMRVWASGFRQSWQSSVHPRGSGGIPSSVYVSDRMHMNPLFLPMATSVLVSYNYHVHRCLVASASMVVAVGIADGVLQLRLHQCRMPDALHSSPSDSPNPHIRFMFCTAWPAAPFKRLSRQETRTSCLPSFASSKPMSQ